MSLQSTISAANIDKPVPLYKQVKDMVLSVIKEKKMAEGAILPSEPDLCSMLRVSSITVRRALRELGQEGWITRRPGIGTLITGKVNAPAKIVVSIRWKVSETAYYAQTLINVFNSMESKECNFRIVSGSDDYKAQYLEYKADGMIIVAPKKKHYAILKEMKEAGQNFVVLGASSPDWDLNFVDCDHAGAAFIATEYLIEQGHRNIGLLSGPEEDYEYQDILKGYTAALEKNNCPVNPVSIKHISSALTAEGHLDAVQDWLLTQMKEKTKFTALLCAGYLFSTDVYICSNNGIIKIPEDISIVTLDETPVDMAFSPPLTAVKQPLKEIAAEAVNALERIRKDSGHYIRKRFKPELIIRKSVKTINR